MRDARKASRPEGGAVIRIRTALYPGPEGPPPVPRRQPSTAARCPGRSLPRRKARELSQIGEEDRPLLRGVVEQALQGRIRQHVLVDPIPSSGNRRTVGVVEGASGEIDVHRLYRASGCLLVASDRSNAVSRASRRVRLEARPRVSRRLVRRERHEVERDDGKRDPRDPGALVHHRRNRRRHPDASGSRAIGERRHSVGGRGDEPRDEVARCQRRREQGTGRRSAPVCCCRTTSRRTAARTNTAPACPPSHRPRMTRTWIKTAPSTTAHTVPLFTRLLDEVLEVVVPGMQVGRVEPAAWKRLTTCSPTMIDQMPRSGWSD